MTRFFKYEELTWPEVAALPRSTHLVIPCGGQATEEWLAERLGHPAQVGLLPPLPYGWTGSRLAVEPQALMAYLANLIESLHQESFEFVYVLVSPGGNPGLPASHALEAPSEPREHPLLGRDTGKVVVLPIGHTEQHGYHLSMNTDTVIIDAIAKAIEAAIPDQAISLPAMPYGVSTHRQAFAGTLNAGGRAFEDFYLNAIKELVAQGFDRIYLISGHGGNCSFLTNVVKYAGERHRRTFCATAWLYLSGPQGIAALEAHRSSPIGGMGHAGELETSLMLHLKPDLVHMERVVDEVEFISTPSYYMDWVEGGTLVANPPWDDDSATGAYGAGSLASAEKGEVWFKTAVEEKINHVFEIHEQHRRREERRRSGYGLWGKSS